MYVIEAVCCIINSGSKESFPFLSPSPAWKFRRLSTVPVWCCGILCDRGPRSEHWQWTCHTTVSGRGLGHGIRKGWLKCSVLMTLYLFTFFFHSFFSLFISIYYVLRTICHFHVPCKILLMLFDYVKKIVIIFWQIRNY